MTQIQIMTRLYNEPNPTTFANCALSDMFKLLNIMGQAASTPIT